MESYPVVIAGAGPVGLSLALALARQGVRTLVLEQKHELSRHSKALGVLPRTLEIFRSWGVLERFFGEGIFLSDVKVHSARDNAVLARLDWSPLRRHTSAAVAGILILPQNRTEALLHDCVREAELPEVRFGHEVTGFTDDGTAVTVRVRPEEGEPYEVRADYLAGCDGPHSRVRRELGWTLRGRTYPARLMLADVRLPDERGSLPFPRFWPQGRGALAAIRFAEGTWRIISTLAPGESDEEATGTAGVGGRVEKVLGPGPFETLWSDVFRIHMRRSPGFRRGRVVLAGDAAHINSPAGGQGMNAGIQDADNLAWKLAHALRGGDAERLLASYEQERRQAVQANVERFTNLLTRLVLLSGPPVRLLLGLVLPRLLRRPAVLARLLPRMGMLDTRYRTSALLRGGGKLTGRRAPDGELEAADGTRRRLLELAGPSAALLLFSDGSAEAEQASQVAARIGDIPGLRQWEIVPAGQKPVGNQLADSTGAVWKTWNARGGLCALIRPDGFVGWSAEAPDTSRLRAGVTGALGQ